MRGRKEMEIIKFIIIWVVIQLVIGSMVMVSVQNQIVEKTLDCSQYEKTVPDFVGGLFWIFAYIDIETGGSEYCDNLSSQRLK